MQARVCNSTTRQNKQSSMRRRGTTPNMEEIDGWGSYRAVLWVWLINQCMSTQSCSWTTAVAIMQVAGPRHWNITDF